MRFYVITGTHKDDLGVGGQGQSDVSKNVRRQSKARTKSWCATSKEGCFRWRDEQEDKDEYRWTMPGKWQPRRPRKRLSKRKRAERARRSGGLM